VGWNGGEGVGILGDFALGLVKGAKSRFGAHESILLASFHSESMGHQAKLKSNPNTYSQNPLIGSGVDNVL